MNTVPILDMGDNWSMTADLGLAMSNNYIGEQTLRPKVLSAVVSEILTGKRLMATHVYYYGTPNARLRKLFYWD